MRTPSTEVTSSIAPALPVERNSGEASRGVEMLPGDTADRVDMAERDRTYRVFVKLVALSAVHVLIILLALDWYFLA